MKRLYHYLFVAKDPVLTHPLYRRRFRILGTIQMCVGAALVSIGLYELVIR